MIVGNPGRTLQRAVLAADACRMVIGSTRLAQVDPFRSLNAASGERRFELAQRSFTPSICITQRFDAV
jgi:hypothetical protein